MEADRGQAHRRLPTAALRAQTVEDTVVKAEVARLSSEVAEIATAATRLAALRRMAQRKAVQRLDAESRACTYPSFHSIMPQADIAHHQSGGQLWELCIAASLTLTAHYPRHLITLLDPPRRRLLLTGPGARGVVSGQAIKDASAAHAATTQKSA